MVSDDLTAFAAIWMGALTSAAVTVALVVADPEPRQVDGGVSLEAAPRIERTLILSTAGPKVDFAIIRPAGERPELHLMVGPEGAHSGWMPEETPLQLRLLRAR